MFSLARALPSPTSAEDCSSLFGWFIGTTARSDSSGACVLALWLWAFANRSRSWSDRDAPEVSRFSCMLFLSVRGFLDYAGPTDHSRPNAASHFAFLPLGTESAPCSSVFRSSIARPTDTPDLRFDQHLDDVDRKIRGQDGFAAPFLYDSFIRYNMPVYPGAPRDTPEQPLPYGRGSDGVVETTRLRIGAATVRERSYAQRPGFATETNQPDQKLTRRENSITRGCCEVVLMLPKSVLVGEVLGAPKWVWFMELKASARSCIVSPSRSR